MVVAERVCAISRMVPAVTSPQDAQPPTVRPVRYKGELLDAARGPGLGCFWLQIVTLAVLIVLTPLSAWWGWPDWLSAALLFITIGLLLVAGQTMIFLLRLVAADRRSRRRPLASGTRTVGEIEDSQARDLEGPDALAQDDEASDRPVQDVEQKAHDETRSEGVTPPGM
jgi:hypothetical protein